MTTMPPEEPLPSTPLLPVNPIDLPLPSADQPDDQAEGPTEPPEL